MSNRTEDLLFRRGQAVAFGTQEGKRDEMVYDSLEEQRRQTALLQNMLQQGQQGVQQVQTPVIELGQEFDRLVGAQQELSYQVREAGYTGQMALQEARDQTGFLESLDGHAREAYWQRNEALTHLSEALVEHRSANRHLSGIERGVVDVRDAIGQSTSALGQHIERGAVGIRDAIGQSTSALGQHIERGAVGIRDAIGQSTSALGQHIQRLNSSLTHALGDLGSDIHHLDGEMVKTRLEVVRVIKDLQEIFLWSHRDAMWMRQQTLDTMQHPRHTASRETWWIGEQCRRAGNRQGAIRMFQEGLSINPAEARNHVSLGLMGLELGIPEVAKNYFATGARYDVDPGIKATSLMYLAKVEMFERNYSQAKAILEVALEADVTNLEIWFDLAVCEMRLGDRQKALYYIRNLLYVPMRVPKKDAPGAAQYAMKIVAETVFTPLMPQIRRIMLEIIAI